MDLSESRAAQHLYGKFTSFEGRLFPEEVVKDVFRNRVACLFALGE